MAAWRTLDTHTEGGFGTKRCVEEDRMTPLMEQKVPLAESVKDKRRTILLVIDFAC